LAAVAAVAAAIAVQNIQLKQPFLSSWSVKITSKCEHFWQVKNVAGEKCCLSKMLPVGQQPN